jgi:hypothetical protein
MIHINKNTPICDIVSKHPDIKEIMVQIGFKDIVKPGMLQSVGRFMTLDKGAKAKHIEWEKIEQIFENHGYVIDKENEHE